MEPKMFEDIHELAENSAYLKAIEEKEVSLEMLDRLPPYEELKELEEKLRTESKLDFNTIFHEPIGYYMIKCFLVADYVGDKAIFIKDVEAYHTMRFESARIKVATLLYHRFIADDDQHKYPPLSSVFSLLQKKPEYKNEELSALRDPDEEDDPRHEQAKDARLASATTDDDDDDDENPDAPAKEKKSKPLPPVADEYPDSEDEKKDDPVPPPPAPTAAPVNVPNPANGSAKPVEERLFRRDSAMFNTGATNAIGVYGKSVKAVKERLARGEAPKDLFDEVAEDVMNDLQFDVFPRFKQSSFFKKYIRAKSIEYKPVAIKDFTLFRVLGRGGFGTVYACRKIDSGALYAMKAINKKLVKMKQALDNVMEERNVLALLNSKFVTNVKYALQNEENLYLVMDLMLGGDLKYHLINAGRFTEERARFYSAEVLLGLEHIHSLNIIYRDMKLENVLLDDLGHCRLSDMGLAVITKEKIRGYAGTPGYTAPEMIKNKPYGSAVDIFSYGVMLYRMLCGAKPFKGKIDRDLDKAVVEREPKFPPDIFSPEATDLLTGLLQKRPEKRLGCGPKGIEEIKEHPFFHSIDWGLLEAGYVDPPFVPTHDQIHAAKLTDIGEFDVQKLKSVKLPERFKKRVKTFDHISIPALHSEMVAVLEKADKGFDYSKFSNKRPPQTIPEQPSTCCAVQ